MTAAATFRCVACDEPIGVYEPLVVRLGAAARETSIAAEPSLPLPGAEHYHSACFEGPLAAAADLPAEVVPIRRPSDRPRGSRSQGGGSDHSRLTG